MKTTLMLLIATLTGCSGCTNPATGKRTFLPPAWTLLLLCMFLSGCGSTAFQNYNSHVAARQVGVGGNYNPDTQSGKGTVSYRVEYR